jgi:type IV fimbrial biogenesis protein FimT
MDSHSHFGCLHRRLGNAPRQTALAGFTLVEMVTALSVLGLLAMAAVPMFRELAASQRVQTAASDLQTSLLRARSEAIKQNTVVTMMPVGTWKGGWVISAGGAAIDMRAPTPSISITGPGSVDYRSNGRITGGTVPQFTVSHEHTSLQRCVQVSLNGQPIVTKAACS